MASSSGTICSATKDFTRRTLHNGGFFMGRKKAERPGIVVYFDAIPTLQKLSADGKACFLMAVLNYGKTGEMPDLSDLQINDQIRLETLFEQTFPRMDADEAKWERNVLQKSYAGYSSAAKNRGEEPMSHDEYSAWNERASELGYI